MVRFRFNARVSVKFSFRRVILSFRVMARIRVSVRVRFRQV